MHQTLNISLKNNTTQLNNKLKLCPGVIILSCSSIASIDSNRMSNLKRKMITCFAMKLKRVNNGRTISKICMFMAAKLNLAQNWERDKLLKIMII